MGVFCVQHMRKCIFCLGKANSREDAWPVWLVESLVPKRPSPTIEATLGPNFQPITWGGRYVKVRYLCKDCNTGWMSRLESDTKPFLEPLIHDSASTLDFPQQCLLSFWIAKTAMVFECTDRTKNWFYSDSERQHVPRWCTPSADTVIWIGRYANGLSLSAQGNNLSSPRDKSVLSAARVTTLLVGHFVVQVVTVRSKPGAEARGIIPETTQGPWDRLLTQVWPAVDRVIRWPPVLSFDDSENRFERLLQRFDFRTPVGIEVSRQGREGLVGNPQHVDGS
jgi:hypothetical protein